MLFAALDGVEHGAPKGGVHRRVFVLAPRIARRAKRLLGDLAATVALVRILGHGPQSQRKAQQFVAAGRGRFPVRFAAPRLRSPGAW